MVDRKERMRTNEARVLLAAVSLLGVSVGLTPSTPAGAYDDTAQPFKTAANKTKVPGSLKWGTITLKKGVSAPAPGHQSLSSTGGAPLKPSSTQGASTTPINPALTGQGSGAGSTTTTGVKPKLPTAR
jgi:hypothetical protein